MYFDTLTLAAVADELREHVLGGRIQRVLLPGPMSVGLEIYAHGQRHQLLASAHTQFARVHLVQRKLSRGVETASPLLLLLRKYVLGGKITAIEQPDLERILLLSIVKEVNNRNRREDFDTDVAQADDETNDSYALDAEINDQIPAFSRGERELLHCDLVIEPMDRRSNIILVDDGNAVLESVKRVTPRMSRRVILPRHVYELPPGQEKRDPRRATATGIEALRETGERDLARAIVGSYRGVSPQAAREVVQRAVGRSKVDISEDLPWYSVAAHLRELFTMPWQPSLAAADTGYTAYAPYLLTHLANVTTQPSMSAALEAFYAAREVMTNHSQRREAVRQQLDAAQKRYLRRYDQIETELTRAQALERLRWEGEMIYAFMHNLEPGQTVLDVDGEQIAIEPGRSVVEQAQERFRAYDKAKSALAGLPERLAATQTQLDSIAQLAALLELTDDHAQIEQLALEAEEQGYIDQSSTGSQRPRRQRPIKPLRLVSSDGFDIFVGRSARQNDEVTFRVGRPEDTWLHVRTIHGAHVIVRSEGREVPERTLEEAAGVAAYFSQARNEPAVDVDLSRRSRVRKVSGGPPGLAIYQAERTLRVQPLPPWE